MEPVTPNCELIHKVAEHMPERLTHSTLHSGDSYCAVGYLCHMAGIPDEAMGSYFLVVDLLPEEWKSLPFDPNQYATVYAKTGSNTVGILNAREVLKHIYGVPESILSDMMKENDDSVMYDRDPYNALQIRMTAFEKNLQRMMDLCQ